jgi:hypothetical protein
MDLHCSSNLGANRIISRTQWGRGEMRIPRGRGRVFVTEAASAVGIKGESSVQSGGRRA